MVIMTIIGALPCRRARWQIRGVSMPATPVVETSKGTVRGTVEDGIEVFLGIPYGAPTGGANRFRPPRPRAPWTGHLDSTAYGPTCPQTVLISHMREELRALRA